LRKAALGLSSVWGPTCERILIVGLTGGIASGKSEALREFRRLGAFTIDADEVAREVVLPGNEAYDQVVSEFGNGVLDEYGNIDRNKLAAVVFANEEKRLKLNAITHPAIFKEIAKRLTDFSSSLKPKDIPVAIVDAALIVDVGVAKLFDLVVVVTSSEEERLSRLVSKRGMSREEALKRIKSQVPEEKRLSLADLVIDNDKGLEELKNEVRRVWSKIAKKALELRD